MRLTDRPRPGAGAWYEPQHTDPSTGRWGSKAKYNKDKCNPAKVENAQNHPPCGGAHDARSGIVDPAAGTGGGWSGACGAAEECRDPGTAEGPGELKHLRRESALGCGSFELERGILL